MRLQVEKLEECLEAADKRNQLDRRFVNTTKAAQGKKPEILKAMDIAINPMEDSQMDLNSKDIIELESIKKAPSEKVEEHAPEDINLLLKNEIANSEKQSRFGDYGSSSEGGDTELQSSSLHLQ